MAPAKVLIQIDCARTLTLAANITLISNDFWGCRSSIHALLAGKVLHDHVCTFWHGFTGNPWKKSLLNTRSRPSPAKMRLKLPENTDRAEAQQWDVIHSSTLHQRLVVAIFKSYKHARAANIPSTGLRTVVSARYRWQCDQVQPKTRLRDPLLCMSRHSHHQHIRCDICVAAN